MAKRTDWLGLWADTFRLGAEAQTVIGLRMMRIAAGGALGQAEAARMVTEKTTALVEAQMEMARSFMSGAAHLGPGRAVASYRRHVRANRRRLSR